MATTLSVESQDVIRLVMQFLKENGLYRSLNTLQEESRVTLNTVDSMETFLADINHGNWHKILQIVGYVNIPARIIMDLYEIVAFELLDLEEVAAVKLLLKETGPFITMRADQPERYRRIEKFILMKPFKYSECFDGMSKEKKRQQIAQALVPYIQTAPPSRLLSLIGQAVKWQQHVGLLTLDEKLDMFRGVSAKTVEEMEDEYVKSIAHTIKFAKKTHPECAAFSPDGQYLATGSVDGFIEIWDHRNGKLRKDLEYQKEEEFMVHENAVVAMVFNKDSELLASGSADGQLKVWKVLNGQCLKHFPKAHDDGIAWINWARDGSQLLTGSFDMTARIHGMRSGNTLKVFRGHTSFVNSAVFTPDSARVVTASADGYIKIWETKTTEVLDTFAPPPPPHMNSVQLVSANVAIIVPNQEREPTLYVSTRCSQVFLMNMTGQVLKIFASGKREGGDFSSICVSPRNKWVYAFGEDHRLYVFNVETGKLESIVPNVCTKDAIAVAHHPNRNLVAAVSTDGTVALLRP